MLTQKQTPKQFSSRGAIRYLFMCRLPLSSDSYTIRTTQAHDSAATTALHRRRGVQDILGSFGQVY